MAQEIEAKFLKIGSIEGLENKLATIGAKRKSEKLFKSSSFDFPGYPLDKDAAWVRLRDEGDRITLAYKKRLGATGDLKTNDSGMEEIEIEVSDFETTKAIFMKIGMVEKFAQEKKRITWTKGDVTFDIDTWPRLEPYLEIEAPTWDQVENAAKELGLDFAEKQICSATQIYQMAGIRDKDYSIMTFEKFVKRVA